ncbi:hypothetical protein HER12_000235 [Spiroplasma platyhelix PALS-1]|nr:hypothetical protein [Spiroplasma platyhelix PALS-1]UJB29256.1 hypothetical protein SPLAT_v1c04920 [Spiroplasma platyhelix PALS-1]
MNSNIYIINEKNDIEIIPEKEKDFLQLLKY